LSSPDAGPEVDTPTKKTSKGKAAAQIKKVDTKHINKAKKNNPPGVRIIGDKIEDNSSLLAGYLNFATVTEFKAFLTSNCK